MTYLQYLKKNKYIKDNKINDYLLIKNNCLYYKDINLFEVSKKYNTPIEFVYPAMIDQRIREMRKFFNKAIKKNKYNGKYIYAYATKANYYEETLRHVLNMKCAIETTSEYDARLGLFLKRKKKINENQLIICNGFKTIGYSDIIKKIRRIHKNVIPVIENYKDIEYLKDINEKIDVGIRLKIDIKTTRQEKFGETHNRFGFYSNEIDKVIARMDKIKNFNLKVLHIMIGSQIEDPILFKRVLKQALQQYCRLKKKHPSIQFFDIGGGIPVQYRLGFDFNYEAFINDLVSTFKATCRKEKVDDPDLITEYGRYTVSDYAAELFSVSYEKSILNKDINWYILDGSIMINLPDAWALGQDFLCLPLNGYNRPIKKVWLAGITCDHDDVYHGSKGENYMMLPEIQEDLKVGFFACGSYQANISGIGGVHHCMLPEPSELIVEKENGKNKFKLVTRKQSFEKVIRLLDYLK